MVEGYNENEIRKNESLEEKVDKLGYIAHEVEGPHDIDEIMELVIAYQNGENVGIYGPPGLGKTLLVKTFAELVGKDLEVIQCAPETSITDIVGGEIPDVARDENGKVVGGIIIKTVKKALAKAMEEGKIFYADEWNKLRRDVQSYLSAPLDFRRELRSLDGQLLVEKAKDGFMFIASWNPGEEYGGEEVLGYIKDRITYTPFNELDTDLQARITLVKAGLLSPEEILDNKIQIRAIVKEGDKFKFFVKQGEYFVNFFDKNEKLDENDPRLRKYLCFVGGEGKLQVNDERKQEMYENIYNLVQFVKQARHLILYGSSGIDPELDNLLGGMGISRIPPLHEEYHIEPRSIRILEAVAKEYKYFVDANAPPEIIAKRLSKKIINGIIQDKGNEEVASGITWENLVKKIAQMYSIKINGEPYQLVREEEFAQLFKQEEDNNS